MIIKRDFNSLNLKNFSWLPKNTNKNIQEIILISWDNLTIRVDLAESIKVFFKIAGWHAHKKVLTVKILFLIMITAMLILTILSTIIHHWNTM